MTEVNDSHFTIQYQLAQHYFTDARDFCNRFDILWEAELHKTGRVKSFVDLLMGCECILKSHIFLSRIEDDPTKCYSQIRSIGHNISALANEADKIKESDSYKEISAQLEPFSVFLRYSFDMWETFFPSSMDASETTPAYSSSIGNNEWVLNIRSICETLITQVSKDFNVLYTDEDITKIMDSEIEMASFVSANIKKP